MARLRTGAIKRKRVVKRDGKVALEKAVPPRLHPNDVELICDRMSMALMEAKSTTDKEVRAFHRDVKGQVDDILDSVNRRLALLEDLGPRPRGPLDAPTVAGDYEGGSQTSMRAPDPLDRVETDVGGALHRLRNRTLPVVAEDPWRHRAKGMSCGTCMWYVPKAVTVEKGRDVPPELGRCRRHAPTMGGYPAVFPADWCGDHKLDETKL
jgi:hypothetical protein